MNKNQQGQLRVLQKKKHKMYRATDIRLPSLVLDHSNLQGYVVQMTSADAVLHCKLFLEVPVMLCEVEIYF